MSKWIDLIPRPRSMFIRIKCLDCGNEQIIFQDAKMFVKCNVCDEILAEPKGGKAKIRGTIIDFLDERAQ